MNEQGPPEDAATPEEIIGRMYENDRFSRLLGIRVEKVSSGHCVLTMKIREEMANGFGIVHGGVTFALGDSALAFASNAHGRICLALEASISYPAQVRVGDTLTATAEEISLTNRIGVYTITITNQDGRTVGHFRGTVYRTNTRYLDLQGNL